MGGKRKDPHPQVDEKTDPLCEWLDDCPCLRNPKCVDLHRRAFQKNDKVCVKVERHFTICSIKLDQCIQNGLFDYLVVYPSGDQIKFIAIEIHRVETGQVKNIIDKFDRTEKWRKEHNCPPWDYYWIPPKGRGNVHIKSSSSMRKVSQRGIQIRPRALKIPVCPSTKRSRRLQ